MIILDVLLRTSAPRSEYFTALSTDRETERDMRYLIPPHDEMMPDDACGANKTVIQGIRSNELLHSP